MKQFGIETRQWLLSVIKQRKLLLLRKESHKPELHVEIALKMLEDLLSSYSYSNPLYMARFINQYTGDISVLLPGKGSTCYEKRKKEFNEICRKAILIQEEAQGTGLRAQVKKNPSTTSRLFIQEGNEKQYELSIF